MTGEKKVAVLFVDDDEHLLRSMKRTFERKFDVTIAECASTGLEKLKEKSYAVVVSDFKMPHMTGVEFFMLVKELSPATTRIMLSGQADMAVALDALNKGNVFRFLEKPTAMEDLEKVILQGVDEYTTFVETKNRMLFDALTDCYNRKTILEYLALEVERSQRYTRPLSIAMMDIDHFKKVNDSFGHLVGDMVLQEVVSGICSRMRRVDFVGRYGGEEFLIIFPETSEDQATQACEKLRLSLQEITFDSLPELSISATFGVAGYLPGSSAKSLLKEADTLLYVGKNRGRNRVVGVGSLQEESSTKESH